MRQQRERPMEAFDVIAVFGMILAAGALGLASDQAKKITALRADLERLRSRFDERETPS